MSLLLPKLSDMRTIEETEGCFSTVQAERDRIPFGDDKRLILDTVVRALTRDEAVREIKMEMHKGRLKLAFVNAHLALHAARSTTVKDILAEFLLLVDGLGMDISSKMLFGRKFPGNLNGTDFIPALLDRVESGRRIFLLGTTQEAIIDAVAFYRKNWPQHLIVGSHNGFFSPEDEGAVAEKVRAAQPDLILVGMGCPRQELWIAKYVPEVCPVGIAVGALFDIQTGRFPRAPALIRRWRCEWLYRMYQEPRRLAGRYLIGHVEFLGRVCLQKFRNSRFYRD